MTDSERSLLLLLAGNAMTTASVTHVEREKIQSLVDEVDPIEEVDTEHATPKPKTTIRKSQRTKK